MKPEPRVPWLLPLLLAALPPGFRAGAQDRLPYLVPPIVYVGDRAILVAPLAGGGASRESQIVLDPKLFPYSPDIELHRVALERRASGSRLLIEFSAFTPGTLELPPVEIGGERFAGLRVEISSIIGGGDGGTVLSGPAPPLAIPGTGLLVYGTMGVFALCILLALWAGLWGRRRLGGWLLRWKRMRLILSMSGIERRLRRSLSREGGRRDLLDTLSGEFRSFLSFFTGANCRAMTAAELGRLPPLASAADTAAVPGDLSPVLGGGFLGTFFSRCDGLRFSGSAIAGEDINRVLADLRRFLEILYRAERGKFRRKEEAA